MTESITFLDISSPQTTLATVEIFDPPMCCPTGMCGPTIDQTLLDVNEMILGLQAEGITIVRYQMTSHPHAFLNNSEVMRLVREQQMAALPITAVNGKVVKTSSYPSLTEIKAALNGSEE
ncbi:MAG: Arsenical resistance operon trans-acting repressor ArsD [Chloroflexi bacterium]|jgi:hypothetical protein|nr:Arsenical resistance operon trans-acting repressor ArsD [Chloroflexota bacterium]